jgi:hypothetical protein
MNYYIGLLAMAFSVGLHAQTKVAFFIVKTGDPTSSMRVVLDGPPVGDFADSSKYRVVALNSSLPGGQWKWIDLASVKINVDNTVDLIPVNATEVKGAAQLQLLVGSMPGVALTKEKPLSSGFGKATKDKSDVYISLTYSPGLSATPQYSIDTSVGLLFPLRPAATNDFGYLGFLAAVKTDKRPQADPDSYRLFGVYQRAIRHAPLGPAQGVLFTWLVAGGEFERQANNINFISSPLVEIPIRLRGEVNNKKTIIPVLVPEFGMELGTNLKNAVTPAGQGIIGRGVLGATLGVTVNPTLKLFQAVHLTSSYKVRLPATSEVFTNTTTNTAGKVVDVPFLSTKPRHYIKNELGFTLWDPISFTITHEYGAIPPAFRLIDHKVSIGFVLTLQQKQRLTSGLAGK